MKIQVRTTLNLEAWEKLIKNLPDNATGGLTETAEEIIKDIRANWSAISPSAEGAAPAKRSGDLDASLEPQPAQRPGGSVFQVTIKAVAPGSKYAGYLEFGTRKMAARPFFRPAVKRAKETLRAKLKVVFDK